MWHTGQGRIYQIFVIIQITLLQGHGQGQARLGLCCSFNVMHVRSWLGLGQARLGLCSSFNVMHVRSWLGLGQARLGQGYAVPSMSCTLGLLGCGRVIPSSIGYVLAAVCLAVIKGESWPLAEVRTPPSVFLDTAEIDKQTVMHLNLHMLNYYPQCQS